MSPRSTPKRTATRKPRPGPQHDAHVTATLAAYDRAAGADPEDWTDEDVTALRAGREVRGTPGTRR